MAKSKLKAPYEKIEKVVVDGYNKIEKTVVNGYHKVEKSVTGGYQKIEDKFIDQFLTKDGETIEEAKLRLKSENENKKNN